MAAVVGTFPCGVSGDDGGIRGFVIQPALAICN